MRTLIINIGIVATGDIDAPIADADSILIEDGRITAVGRGLDGDAGAGSGGSPGGADLQVIDAKGTTAMPGLIDSHAHPVFGDFTPRQQAQNFIESGLHGGVTTVISAGEVHLPGRPKDIVGLKALAIVAAKAYGNFRPGGVKVRAGAPILELGLEEHDFAEMAAGGVTLVGEIGLGSVRTGAQAAPMVAWAKQHGMTVTFHTGGPSIAGSNPIAADAVLEARPHIVGHVNGGTTPMSDADIERVVDTEMAIEIVHCGNGRAAIHALRAATALGGATGGGAKVLDGLRRVIVGNDAPSGTGVVPLGILRVLAHLASLGGVAPEIAVAMATGNTARVHGLDVGVLAPGRAADIVLSDAPIGSQASTALDALRIGDLPGVSMVLIDGAVMIGRSRNTPPAARAAEVVGGGGPAAGGH
ncbi:MAG TPA: amidohydrolase family protein [Candidatus Limnocylindria bacterium]|nr:amidohydrolase family protein [Candidatus Limnocylindria bacterium]